MVGPGYGSPIPPLDGASGGQPLPPHLASDFGGRLGADLGAVRVHTGAESGRLADSLEARAFTAGQDIHFGPGQYDPDSREGQRLLAHEVVHTVQGSATAASPATKRRTSTPDEPHEIEADAAAAALVEGTGPVHVSRGAAGETIHRKPTNAGEASAPYTPADQVEQVRLALRAATTAARTAIAAARKTRIEAEAHAALDRGARSIDDHLRFARSSMDAVDVLEVKPEAAALAAALADFSVEAAGLETASIQSVRAQTLTVDAWAQAAGEPSREARTRFGADDARRGVGLSLRATRDLAERAIEGIRPQADGDTRPAATALAETHAALILPHLTSARTLLADHFPEPTSRTALAENVATASQALGDLIAWAIYMRAEKGQLDLAEAAMNEVRVAVGLPDSGWLGARPKKEPRPAVERGMRITTKDIRDARLAVMVEYRDLAQKRADGVGSLLTTIPMVDRRDGSWLESTVAILANAALHAVTGFLGGAIAHKLAAAGASAASRGLNTAVNDALKVSLRLAVDREKTSVFASEAQAAGAFCEGQKNVLEKDEYTQGMAYVNSLEPFYELETRQKGAGIAELELLRHSIAEVKETMATDAQYDASLAEWLKVLARASAGPVDRSDPSSASNPEALADFNEFHRGVLHLYGTPDPTNPSAPLAIRGASIRGINNNLIRSLRGIDRSIGELRLPVHLRTAQFALGMNETGHVWLTVVSGLAGLFSWDTTSAYRYLYRRAHRDDEVDEERVKAGAIDGARKLMLEEVAPMKLSDLAIQDSGLIR
jgi:Domain of unknown function (DUF4157)